MDILVQYYSRRNAGDDLFIDLLARHFTDCRLSLIASPRYRPLGLPEHVRLHPISYSRAAWRIVQRVAGLDSPLSRRIGRRNAFRLQSLADSSEAYVNIGGSIFMESGEEERPFRGDGAPCFDYVSTRRPGGRRFLIGANLGPAFTDEYGRRMCYEVGKYTHACLRDWASYTLVRKLGHAQYAPDVIFLAQQPAPTETDGRAVISVVDIRRHTADEAVAAAYERLLADTVRALRKRNVPVTLCSFCRAQGDERAIHRILALLEDKSGVSTHFYRGDLPALLQLFSNAGFVVASRFHAMILGMSFGKPVFPIAYDCKTRHYLDDLAFAGASADLCDLPRLTADDVLSNYDRHILADCAAHKAHAANQFRALRDFVDAHHAKETTHA